MCNYDINKLMERNPKYENDECEKKSMNNSHKSTKMGNMWESKLLTCIPILRIETHKYSIWGLKSWNMFELNNHGVIQKFQWKLPYVGFT